MQRTIGLSHPAGLRIHQFNDGATWQRNACMPDRGRAHSVDGARTMRVDQGVGILYHQGRLHGRHRQGHAQVRGDGGSYLNRSRVVGKTLACHPQPVHAEWKSSGIQVARFMGDIRLPELIGVRDQSDRCL